MEVRIPLGLLCDAYLKKAPLKKAPLKKAPSVYSDDHRYFNEELDSMGWEIWIFENNVVPLYQILILKFTKMRKVFFTAIFAAVLVSFASCRQQSKSETSCESTDVVVTDMHSTRISVNWQGTYKGTTPCADCEGIQTSLTLNDSTYVLETVYLGKSNEVFKTEGRFVWNDEGSRITLDNEKTNGFNTQFRVGENVVWQLDSEGKQIEGEFAAMYELYMNK